MSKAFRKAAIDVLEAEHARLTDNSKQVERGSGSYEFLTGALVSMGRALVLLRAIPLEPEPSDFVILQRYRELLLKTLQEEKDKCIEKGFPEYFKGLQDAIAIIGFTCLPEELHAPPPPSEEEAKRYTLEDAIAVNKKAMEESEKRRLSILERLAALEGGGTFEHWARNEFCMMGGRLGGRLCVLEQQNAELRETVRAFLLERWGNREPGDKEPYLNAVLLIDERIKAARLAGEKEKINE